MFDFLFEIWVELRLCFSTGIPSKVSQTMGARIYSRFQETCFFLKIKQVASYQISWDTENVADGL